MTIPQDDEIVLETPIDCLDGGVRPTLVGDGETVRGVVEAIPGSLTVSLEGIGRHHPQSEGLFSSLTSRQQEILGRPSRWATTTCRGRRSTGTAEVAGISAGAVGEHLRKVEGEGLSTLVR